MPINAGQNALIAVNMIVPSKSNRTISDASIAEMATSIKKSGVLQPIVVRAIDKTDKYEIVVGERRWRGAKLAGLNAIPAVVGKYTDEEAQAMRIVENLHRSDPTPMEEAEAFGNLRKLLGKNATIEQVATQVGKDGPHVAQRLKLLDLIPEAQKALREQRIGISHGLILAPLEVEVQKDALKWLTYEESTDRRNYGDEHVKSTHTAAALQAYVEREHMLSLEKAPFDVKDATLDKKMGSCLPCPFNTANAASLFPNLKGATCTKPECYFNKTRISIDIKVGDIAKADGRKPYRLGFGDQHANSGKSKVPVDGYLAVNSWDRGPRLVEKGKECKAAVTAVLVYRGKDEDDSEIKAAVGDVTIICPDPQCPTHGSRTGSSGDSAGVRKALKGMAFVKHREGNLKKSQPQRLRWAIFKDLAVRLLKGKYNTDNQDLMLLAAEQASNHLYYDAARDAAKALGYEKPKKEKRFTSRPDWEQLLQKHFKGNPWAWLMAINAAEDIRKEHGRPEGSQLFQIAKAYKVDIGKLRDEIQEADKALVDGMEKRAKEREAKPQKAPKASNAAKRSRVIAGVCRYCKCTDDRACDPPCSWVDKEETVCSNPVCVAKAVEAGVIKKKTKSSAASA